MSVTNDVGEPDIKSSDIRLKGAESDIIFGYQL